MSSKKKANPDRPQAFLIVDGVKVIVIDKETFGIGRKKDNQIIIDNPHVSRHHARIRFIDKKYVLFDLESTAGTSVNGERIQAVLLNPGDVISVGGVPIIFGVGVPGPLPDPSRPTHTTTGPTDATDIENLDTYLDLFKNDK